MPSQRRTRLYVLLLALTIIITLYMTRSGSQTRTSPFYVKTQEALQAKEYVEASKLRDADGVGSRLKAAADDARKAAEKKGQNFVDSVTGGDADKVPRGRYSKDGKQQPLEGVAAVGGRTQDKTPPKENETEDYHEAEVELNTILKKSPSTTFPDLISLHCTNAPPVIIFSKTYCPHSRQAKRILLEKYDIEPAPYVVELNEHPLGPKLQEVLADMTGRRTVPNVLVIGKSIGGGDDMQELHDTDTMIETIKRIGEPRVTRVTKRPQQSKMRRVRRQA
jgi:glutaredoxin